MLTLQRVSHLCYELTVVFTDFFRSIDALDSRPIAEFAHPDDGPVRRAGLSCDPAIRRQSTNDRCTSVVGPRIPGDA